MSILLGSRFNKYRSIHSAIASIFRLSITPVLFFHLQVCREAVAEVAVAVVVAVVVVAEAEVVVPHVVASTSRHSNSFL